MSNRRHSTVTCIICQKDVSRAEATAGALYADGRQAFACVSHAWNKAAWLMEWIRFSIAQEAYSLQSSQTEARRVGV